MQFDYKFTTLTYMCINSYRGLLIFNLIEIRHPRKGLIYSFSSSSFALKWFWPF